LRKRVEKRKMMNPITPTPVDILRSPKFKKAQNHNQRLHKCSLYGWVKRGSERDKENLHRKKEKETKTEMRERSQKKGDDGERDCEKRKEKIKKEKSKNNILIV
jgi:hypothetical protein